jgi:hypothetical protein
MRATELTNCARCGGEIEPGNLIRIGLLGDEHEDCIGEEFEDEDPGRDVESTPTLDHVCQPRLEALAIAREWLYVDSHDFRIPSTEWGLELKWALETLISNPIYSTET